jgi:hypothetical protein
MKDEFLKSISIVEENFDVSENMLNKWKKAQFREYEFYYQEMFDVMRQNMKALNAHKVQCWLEISAYYFDYKGNCFRSRMNSMQAMEIEK